MKQLLFLSMMFLMAVGLHAKTPEEIRRAIADEYASAQTSTDVDSILSSLDENGRWPDIDYSDQSGSRWQLERHLDRIVDLALAYRRISTDNTPEATTAKAALPEIKQAVERALTHWFDHNYTNPNWWYAKIGVPRRMLAIAYLMDDNLSPDLHKKLDGSLDAIDSNDFPARPGGDRIQVLSNHAKVMYWRRDSEGVRQLLDKIEREARIAPFEEVMYDAGGGPGVRNNWRPSGRGVQSDMTFHHRGDRVNSTLTYGQELPEYFTYWALMLKDSDDQFSPESINFIIDYYLDAVMHHLVAGRYAEPSIMNREISRPGDGVFTSVTAKNLLEISDGYRAEELQKAIRRLDGANIPNDTYARFFDQSDYFVFSRPGFQTAVRIYSERNANQEAPHNQEGIRNHFRGDGANMLSVSGREYADIAPVFDFRMIPGATTPMIPYNPPERWGDLVVLNSPIQFAGAVCDSVYGAVAFDFVSSRSDLKARKSWFFFDNEYLCLGAGINSTSGDTIVTTIEQSLSPSGEMNRIGEWFLHNGNGYHILDGKAQGKIENRAGTWGNVRKNVAYETDTIRAEVFSLAIVHGVDPADATYAYAVVPQVGEDWQHRFTILENTSALQAVAATDRQLIYLVFFEPGKVETPYGTFGTEEPCMMMLRDNDLYIFDPTRHLEGLNVTTPHQYIIHNSQFAIHNSLL